jgi:2-polyprenyl-6-methoxyphenol hydroxylase-like FAD-dependent oxidoreductase
VNVTPRSESTDVVVVGAGPTGLTAALRLHQLGIACVVLDAAPGPSETSKAALVHASTVELFAELGLGEALIEAGRKVHRIVMLERGRRLAQVDLTHLPTKYPFALGVPQSITEGLLMRRLAEARGSVRRRHRVTSLVPEGDRYVLVGTAEEDGVEIGFEISARYVVGADGAHSTVRSAARIGFPGETYESQFVLADVALTSAAGADEEATINASPQGVTVIGRLPSGNHRIIATVDPARTVPAEPDKDFVDQLLRERGIPARSTADPVWSSRFRVHHRVADTFRAGGVFLAGDAAHVHSPAAGQGMNTGIADAYDLSTRLAAVLTGQAPESVLDRYTELRRAAALEVLRFTDVMSRMAMLSNPAARLARRAAAGVLLRFDRPVRRRVALWVSGLARSPLRHDLPVVRPASEVPPEAAS